MMETHRFVRIRLRADKTGELTAEFKLTVHLTPSGIKKVKKAEMSNIIFFYRYAGVCM